MPQVVPYSFKGVLASWSLFSFFAHGLMMIPQKVMEQPLVTPGTTVEGVLLPLPPGSAAGRFAFFLNFLAAVTAAWLKRPRFLFFDDAMAAWCS